MATVTMDTSAVKVLTAVNNTTGLYPTPLALATANTAEMTLDGYKGHKILFIVTVGAGGAAVLTFAAGTDSPEAGLALTTASLEANAIHCIIIDSGRFKNLSGASKGKIKINTATTAVTLVAIVLP
jgi:hypothetical protein